MYGQGKCHNFQGHASQTCIRLLLPPLHPLCTQSSGAALSATAVVAIAASQSPGLSTNRPSIVPHTPLPPEKMLLEGEILSRWERRTSGLGLLSHLPCCWPDKMFRDVASGTVTWEDPQRMGAAKEMEMQVQLPPKVTRIMKSRCTAKLKEQTLMPQVHILPIPLTGCASNFSSLNPNVKYYTLEFRSCICFFFFNYNWHTILY